MSKFDWTRNRRPGAVLGGQIPQHEKTTQLPVTMPWGKYRDLPIRELPLDYVRWLVNELNKKPGTDTGLYLALRERIS